MAPPIRDLTGQQFGRLTALAVAGRCPQNGGVTWLCRCACSSEVIVRSKSLLSGNTKSCGCYGQETRRAKGNKAKKHGMNETRIYKAWTSMRRRCLNPSCAAYGDYGGRGITVCDRWSSFENFYADMGDPPPGLTLDRIDNDGPYSPENCRWATRQEQRLNQRCMRLIEHDGLSLSIADWAQRAGLSRSTLRDRLRRGIPLNQAIAAGKETHEQR